ncbi:hypothetical protein D3C79_799950 [compost metagenome]
MPGVGHAGRHAIADANACRLKTALQARDLCGQLGMGDDSPLAILTQRDHRRACIAAPQQVFGEVQCGTGEPARIAHLRAFVEDPGGRLMPAHPEEIGKGLPERGTLVDAPAMQLLVVGQAQTVLAVDLTAKGIHATGLNTRLARAPEHLVHAAFLLCRTLYSTIAFLTSSEADQMR